MVLSAVVGLSVLVYLPTLAVWADEHLLCFVVNKIGAPPGSFLPISLTNI